MGEKIPIFRCPRCGSRNFHYVKRVEFGQCAEFQFDRVIVDAPANQDAYPLYIKPSDPIWCEKCGYKLKRKERLLHLGLSRARGVRQGVLD